VLLRTPFQEAAASNQQSYFDFRVRQPARVALSFTEQHSSQFPKPANRPNHNTQGLHNEIRQLRETISALRAGVDNASVSERTADGEDNRAVEDADREGIHAQSGQMATVYLGSRSVLAYMMGLQSSKSSRDAAKTLLEENILPKLGLDNETATYPFVDLWSTEASTFDVQGLVRALPDDARCREWVSQPGRRSSLADHLQQAFRFLQRCAIRNLSCDT
jgi:hypothetical protein